MARMSLGLIETIGLVAAIVAADAAVKSANVSLVGYELAKGSGMTTVKIEGDVGAVKAAVAAASAAAAKVSGVVSAHVISRPIGGLETMIRNGETVGNDESVLTKNSKIVENPGIVPETKNTLTVLTAETPKAETPKAETPKVETPKAETPKAETPKAETPKAETPKAETPKAKSPKGKTQKPTANNGEQKS